MKPYKRTDRVASLIQQELAAALQRKSDELRCASVSISHVHLAPDFSHAKVFITTLDDSGITQLLDILNSRASFFQHWLAKNLKLRAIPKLLFLYDESIVRSRKLSEIINKL